MRFPYSLIFISSSLAIVSSAGWAFRADPTLSKIQNEFRIKRKPRTPKQVDQRVKQAEKELQKEQPGKMGCRYGKYTGLVEEMTGQWKIKGTDPKQGAIDFIAKYSHLFGSPQGTLKLIESRQGGYVHNSHFQQTYKGLPVWNTDIHVGIERGAIYWIQSPALANLLELDIQTVAKVPLEQAVAEARNFMKLKLPGYFNRHVASGTVSAELGIYWDGASDNFFAVAWRVTFVGPRRFGAHYIAIDAKSAEVLAYYSNIDN